MSGPGSPEVWLLAADGSEIGIVASYEAHRMAEESGLEILVVGQLVTSPSWRLIPVCRLMDFGRFKYEISRREKAQRSKSPNSATKEFYLRPATAPHDLEVTLEHVRRLLGEGHRCKVIVLLSGRETIHPEVARALVVRVTSALLDVADVEPSEHSEETSLEVVLAPRLDRA